MGFLFSVRNVSKTFKLNDDRFLPVLNSISFDLPETGLFCVYGKSGSGKSTLLNILEGLMKPTSGEVIYNGKDISKFNKKEQTEYLKDNIGIIFQSFNLVDDLTVKDNLVLTLKVKGLKNNKIIDEYLEKYNLRDKKNLKIEKLSGGEKQRICIIRALLNSPSVIFADEPTGNLDDKNAEFIMQELKDLSREKLIVLVSHNVELIEKYGDGFLLLEDGNQIRFKSIENSKNLEKIDRKMKKSEFIDFLLLRNFSKNIGKNLLSFFSTLIAFLIIFLAIGVKNGVGTNVKNIVESYQDCNVVEISKIDYEIVNDTNIKFQKTSKVSEDELYSLLKYYDDYEIGYDLSYFFSNMMEATIEGVKFDNVKFIPVNNMDISNVVYVNSDFKEKYSEKCEGSCLNKFISLHLKRNMVVNAKSKNNEFFVEQVFDHFFSFDIEQINTEFDYLNTPKVYFSYNYFVEELSKIKAYDVTRKTGIETSFLDLLADDKNQQVSNYKNLIFFDTFDDTLKFYNRVDKKKFYINNEDIETINSFNELSSSLFEGAKIFIILSCFCVILIVIFLAYFSFIQNRKQSAILSVLGSVNSDIYLLYILEQIFDLFLGYIVSLFVISKTQEYVNLFIYHYTKYKDFVIVPLNDYKLLSLVLLGGVFIVAFGIFLPLIITKKGEVYKELKEE